MKLRLNSSVAAIAILGAAVTATTASTLPQPSRLEVSCRRGSVPAVVAGRAKCLRAGQKCTARFNRVYLRHGFECVRGRLRRRGQSSAPASQPCGRVRARSPAIEHVIWIFMENKRYQDVIGSATAPYENELASRCGLATSYFAVAHPSLPNYIAATSGSTNGISDDKSPSRHPLAVASIFSQAPSWKSYQEDMPSTCFRGDTQLYAVRHDPAAYYTNLACERYDVPLGTTRVGPLVTDLSRGTLPAFSFVTPNLCNDTHDCPVASGDAWLRAWVPTIVASSAYRAGHTALFIVWDEDDYSGSNHIPAIVVSPYTPTSKRSATPYTHYSLLRTTEDLLGLPPLGRAAEAPTMLPDLF